MRPLQTPRQRDMTVKGMPAREDWSCVQKIMDDSVSKDTRMTSKSCWGQISQDKPEDYLECPPFGAALGTSVTLRRGVTTPPYCPAWLPIVLRYRLRGSLFPGKCSASPGPGQ